MANFTLNWSKFKNIEMRADWIFVCLFYLWFRPTEEFLGSLSLFLFYFLPFCNWLWVGWLNRGFLPPSCPYLDTNTFWTLTYTWTTKIKLCLSLWQTTCDNTPVDFFHLCCCHWLQSCHVSSCTSSLSWPVVYSTHTAVLSRATRHTYTSTHS